jgi:hypothetical protein
MISVSQDLACYCCSQARFHSSFRILDNDKCEPGFGDQPDVSILLQPGQVPFQLQDSRQ